MRLRSSPTIYEIKTAVGSGAQTEMAGPSTLDGRAGVGPARGAASRDVWLMGVWNAAGRAADLRQRIRSWYQASAALPDLNATT